MTGTTESLANSLQAALETQIELRNAVLYWQRRYHEAHWNEVRLHNELLAAKSEVKNADQNAVS